MLATQECCPIPGLDDLEAIVKEIGHRQCSLGAPFPIINPSVIDADKPAGRQLKVNRLCAVEMHLVAGNFIDLTTEKLLVPDRSEERRVGKEGGSSGRSRWSPTHTKK